MPFRDRASFRTARSCCRSHSCAPPSSKPCTKRWDGRGGMASERIRVLLVAAHASFAESLRDVLGRTEGIEIVGTAGTVADAVRIADEATPDVILMDQRLPDGSGAEATARVLTRLPKTAVIILTGGGSAEGMLAAGEGGGGRLYLTTPPAGAGTAHGGRRRAAPPPVPPA